MNDDGRPLRIAVVAQNVVSADGQGRFALEVAAALSRAGHDVIVVAHEVAEELRASVEVRRIPPVRGPQLLDDLAFLARASAAVRRISPDVVFAVGPTVVTRRPLVVDAQFSHRQWRRAWRPAGGAGLAHRVHTVAAGVVEARTMGRADVLLAPTPELAASIDPHRDDARLVLVPNGVDPDEFSGIDASERQASRDRFGIPRDAFVVAFLGEYQTARKGLGPLIDAVAQTPDQHLLVAGRGPDLTSVTAGLGLDGRVHEAGFTPARAVLAAADAVAVPSWYEPFSLVALEGAASGLPVILSAAVGAAAHLGETALVVARPRADLLANALRSLQESPALRASLGEGARAVAARLSWPAVASRVVEVVEQSAGSSSTVEPAQRPPRARLRIAYVTDTMADVRMIEGLAGEADVTIVAPSILGDRVTNFWPPRPPAVVDKVLLPGGRVGFVPLAALWLARHRRSYDVVFALDNLVAALAANAGSIAARRPVVLQIGRPTMDYLRCQPPSAKRELRRVVARALVELNERRAAGIGAVSDYCADQCAARNGNVVSIPWYGVDLERFRATVDKPTARRQLDLPVDVPIVMLRSRLAPEKDPETFLQAIRLLRDEGRDLCALYMGGELDEMAEAVARTGVAVLARKPADVDEIPLWYVAADVDVQTSHAEGLGVSPLEAMACGTPAVVTDVGGLPEVVDGGRVGGLVPHGDVGATARAIASFLDDPDLAARTAAAGRDHVVARYSSEGAFRAWHDLAVDVVAHPRRGGRRRDRANPRRISARATRVLFVDHDWRLSGGERDLVDLIRGFPPGSVDAHVALPAEGPLADALRAGGATVHLVTMPEALRQVSRWDLARSPLLAARFGKDVLVTMARLARLARSLRPQVVHTNSMKAHVLSVPAAAVTRRPLVWHVRDILERGWLRTGFTTLGGAATGAVVCISQAVATSMEGTAAARRLRVVYNGVRPLSPSDTEVSQARKVLGADADDVLVGIVGQIAHWKGQDVLLDAAAALGDRLPTARFAIVGQCLFPENEADYERGLHEQAERLGLADRVVFAGQVEPVEPVMAALDVLVHASRLPEPFGRVIVEAMSVGTPVITTSIGAGPELVPPGAGAIVAPDDPGALAGAILAVAPDRATAAGHAPVARQAAAGFDIAATATATLAVYRELGVLGPEPT